MTLYLKRVCATTMFVLLAAILVVCGHKKPTTPTGWDVASPLPQIIRAHYIDPTRMARISKFRSGVGADYSDDFERCRNMKHSFQPRADYDWSALEIIAPLHGTVKEITPEASAATIRIQSQQYPDFEVIIFHVRPRETVAVGKTVRAGENIGLHAGPGVDSEIGLGVHTTKGRKLVSYFDVLPDSLLATFALCQVYCRVDFIISKEERDADPLTCENGRFTSEGTLENWKTLNCHYDVDAWGCPRFVDVNYIDFDRVYKISRFRSAVGHDYSDDFEDCRSMKHYFWLTGESGWETARIYVPVDGVVSWRFEEWLGSQVWIRSKQYPDFQFGVFHVVLQDTSLREGRKVRAGELLGTHYGARTYSDIAVSVDAPEGRRRLVSYFDVMTDALFQRYQARGLLSREEVIISKQQRDAFPLGCSGETFVSGAGVLEDWVTLH